MKSRIPVGWVFVQYVFHAGDLDKYQKLRNSKKTVQGKACNDIKDNNGRINDIIEFARWIIEID
jgi:hypothetical protein